MFWNIVFKLCFEFLCNGLYLVKFNIQGKASVVIGKVYYLKTVLS